MATEEELKPRTKEKHHPKCVKNLRWYFMEYCNNTSIHGFKYLGERRSSVEKLFWALVLTVFLYYCVNMIIKTYQKWERSPVIVSFATTETPIWEIPFPAVTICPRTKAVKSRFNFTEMVLLKNNKTRLNKSKLQKFEYMSLLCSSKLDLFPDNQGSHFTDSGIFDFFMAVQPEFKDTIEDISWSGKAYRGKIYEMFKPIITADGVCYSFNMLDRDQLFNSEMSMDYFKTYSVSHQPPSQWSLEKGYDKDATIDAFPRRTLVSGANGGLDLLLLTLDSDLDYICGDALQGYKVILHHPAMLPNPTQDYFRVSLNQDITVSVKPNIMKTDGSLEAYKPQNRNCYMVTERDLRFFKTYNQQECLFECLANFTEKYCKCVAFYMPRDNTTAICGPANEWCINIAKAKFLAKEITFKIENPDHKEPRNISEEELDQDCNCLPACNSLNFDSEVSVSDWDWRKGREIITKNNESDNHHFSRLRIFFKDMQFITSQRNELYGPVDFLANCGGLIGLFTGFSFISLVEIVYFATLRFACNFRKHGKYQWAGAAELMTSDEDDE